MTNKQEFEVCFGENLKELRKSKGLTQVELAEALTKLGADTSVSQIQSLENNEVFQPFIKTLMMLPDSLCDADRRMGSLLYLLQSRGEMYIDQITFMDVPIRGKGEYGENDSIWN